MSYLEKRKKILEQQKKRAAERKKKAAKTIGIEQDIIKTRAKKSKSSKLGSAQPSKGSKNPTAAMQNKKNGQKKSLISKVNKNNLTSFFNKYIAGSKTKIKTKTPTTKNKIKTMPDKFKTQMSKIAKNEKGVKSSQTDAQKFAKLKSDATKKLMNKKKTSVKKKAPIVTKAQLAKSGLSLRDYMNFLQGKTRRDYKDVRMAALKKRAKKATT